MNEKLKAIINRISKVLGSDDPEYVIELEERLSKEIQQYTDEQALGFAKWVTGKDSLSDTWTDQGLLNGYHESQKP